MEDIETSGMFGTGSGVIVNTEADRYIGFLLGTDDTYLYIKATHRWGEGKPEVEPTSRDRLRKVVDRFPLWKLKALVTIQYRTFPTHMSREEITDAYIGFKEAEAMDAFEPTETFLPEPKAVTVAVPHMSVLSFESLKDVMAGKVIEGLDFPTPEAYNEGYDNPDTPKES